MKVPLVSFRNPGFAQDDRHPVVCTSWEEATAFVAWLSKRTGKQYRLLSEAEWEYAARAGSTTPFHSGNDEKALCTYANVADQSTKEKIKSLTLVVGFRDGHAFTAPVGSLRPNAFGVHDMHGNVFEWVEDCWNENYQGAAPTDGSAWATGNCMLRVMRGGGWWDDDARHARSAHRGSDVSRATRQRDWLPRRKNTRPMSEYPYRPLGIPGYTSPRHRDETPITPH